jgi:hypothetical protein
MANNACDTWLEIGGNKAGLNAAEGPDDPGAESGPRTDALPPGPHQSSCSFMRRILEYPCWQLGHREPTTINPANHARCTLSGGCWKTLSLSSRVQVCVS